MYLLGPVALRAVTLCKRPRWKFEEQTLSWPRIYSNFAKRAAFLSATPLEEGWTDIKSITQSVVFSLVQILPQALASLASLFVSFFLTVGRYTLSLLWGTPQVVLGLILCVWALFSWKADNQFSDSQSAKPIFDHLKITPQTIKFNELVSSLFLYKKLYKFSI